MEFDFIDIATLGRAERERLLAAFDADVYTPAFPRIEHREETSLWLERMAPGSQPLQCVLLARSRRSGGVAGGIVFELYAQAGAALLSYIAIAPAFRGRGLARQLLDRGRAILETRAGQAGVEDPVIFAETEDPKSYPGDKDEILARQRILDALGFLTCGLPYSQPPLREGEPPAAGLQFCVLSETLADGATLPAARIAGFLDAFFAEAPGDGRESRKARRGMQAWLADRDPVRFHRLGGVPKREMPHWRFAKGRDRLSVTFIFADRLKGAGDYTGSGGMNVRLSRLHRKLCEDKGGAALDALVEPVQSYFEDIARGGLGRSGRPLVMLCEPEAEPEADPGRIVTMHRPDITTYAAEGYDVLLHRSHPEDPERGAIRFALRDAMVLFESGDIFYLVSLVPLEDELSKLDEYPLIQLQKLVDGEFEATKLDKLVAFSREATPGGAGGEPLTLAALVQTRIAEMAAARDDRRINAVRDILARHVLHRSAGLWQREEEPLPAFGADTLRGLFMAIDSPFLFRMAAAGGGLSKRGRKAAAPRRGPSRAADYPPHMDPADPLAQGKVLAGFLQGVIAFGEQDESEIADSVRPLCREPLAFARPGCLVQLRDGGWRTLEEGQKSLGTCPYVALTACIDVYNERLLDLIDREIDGLLYGDEHELNESQVRDAAMDSLLRMTRSTYRFLLPQSLALAEQNLISRIKIYRDLLSFKPLNIFRYESERVVFDALAASTRQEERFSAALSLLDRYRDLLQDCRDMRTQVAEQRMSFLLGAITVVGLFGTIAGIIQLDTSDFIDAETRLFAERPLKIFGMTAIAVVILSFAFVVLQKLGAWFRWKRLFGNGERKEQP